MKTILLVIGALASGFYSQTETPSRTEPTNAQSGDRDPWDYLEPGQTIYVNGGPITNNTAERKIVKYCPGKGETCELWVTVAGQSVHVKEEKDPNRNMLEIVTVKN